MGIQAKVEGRLSGSSRSHMVHGRMDGPWELDTEALCFWNVALHGQPGASLWDVACLYCMDPPIPLAVVTSV